MAIEKMSLVNLVGELEDLDNTLLRCLNSGYFHEEISIHSEETVNGFSLIEGENFYANPLNKIILLADELDIKLHKTDFDMNNLDLSSISKFIDNLQDSVLDLTKKSRDVNESINQHEQAIIQIKHLAGMNASFDDIFACKYVKVRFGRLPYDSFSKLNYYENKTFFFFPFDHDDEYYWGVYFAPESKIAIIDDIFTSLYFERVRVPDYAHGTPEIATANINKILDLERKELLSMKDLLEYIKKENAELIREYYCILTFANSTFNMRKDVATINGRFYLVGFIPKINEDEFEKTFAELQSVSCVFKPEDADPMLDAPVKLRNNKFSAPFEIFVNMYSLPSKSDVDPTNLVAITYTLLFGIMFGDLGQGVLIAILGFVMCKFMKMEFGKILTRIGISSAIFGTIYGSVFGLEHLLDPMYKALFNMDSKPVHVFDADTTNILLVGAVAIGVTLIAISMCINIFVGIRAKDYERGVFGHNGIAGLVLYLSAVIGLVSTLLLGKNLFTPLYIIGLIVIPFLLIFFRQPLGAIVKKRKDIFHESISEFIISNIFELFEYVLSYLSNSMSFLRVGGFILSHAGMMAVVLSLSEMASSGASVVILIIGNLFVMALEGLIVGIQCLRLEFYEIFSRNFDGNGKPFEPLTVSYELDK